MITQEILDDDQAFYCSHIFPKEFYREQDNEKSLESYKVVILDFSENIKPVKIKENERN